MDALLLGFLLLLILWPIAAVYVVVCIIAWKFSLAFWDNVERLFRSL